MILQALKEYYDRKEGCPESVVAPAGFETKEFSFIIVIDLQGKFIELDDLREIKGKKLVGKSFLVPRSQPRSGCRSYETTFLLWDHFGYLLGHWKSKNDKSKEKAAKEIALRQHRSWKKSLQSLPDVLKEDEGVGAVLKFYTSGGVERVKTATNWTICAELPFCNMTFRLCGEKDPVPCRPAVQEYIRGLVVNVARPSSKLTTTAYGCCLVTGEYGEIARIHSDTRINKDSKKLVGFQKNSGYDSYGKEQAYNAPIIKSVEFAYTTALNTLLKSDRSRMLIGDAITVFWSEKESDLETQFPDIFGEPPSDDPDRCVGAVRSLYRSLETGVLVTENEVRKFYVLGLAPSSARIAVRFWIVDTIAGMSRKIIEHFEDLRIVHGEKEKDALSLFRLLVSTAAHGKSENILPNLAGEIVRAILQGLPYPRTLLQAVVRRIRAEQAAKDKKKGKPLPNVTYPRAALIKACINREARFRNKKSKEELKMSLDVTNSNIGYRLGRLFSVLEKIQGEASPGINATIRDRFYGAASSTPIAVFSNLMRLKVHHLNKLEHQGRRVYFEKLIAEVMEGIEDFPFHLSLADQGRFAIGYYHQTHQFYTKKESEVNNL